MGLFLNVTISEVLVADVTVPVAPSLKVTVLLASVVSKPNPLIVIVVAEVARLEVFCVTTGEMLAISTAVPLLSP